MTPKNYVYHWRLGCSLGAITFPDAESVTLHLQEGHCCDRGGAIHLANVVTRSVEGFELRTVRTMSGTIPDTVYTKDGEGRWIVGEL